MHDCAAIITTALRPTLEHAVHSAWAQDLSGSLQVVVAVDGPVTPAGHALLERLRAQCPPRRSLTVIAPGYSTAAVHGGLYTNSFGGILPAVGSFAADSRYIAYLDDDDWWGPEHMSGLLNALQGRPWGHSLSWYVNPVNDEPICIDQLESTGPGRGVYRARFGGFVRPSCLMVDKLQCAEMLHLWANGTLPNGAGSDRGVFGALLQHRPSWAESRLASSYYRINPADVNHGHRLVYARAMGYDITRVPNHQVIDEMSRAGESWGEVQAVLQQPPHV